MIIVLLILASLRTLHGIPIPDPSSRAVSKPIARDGLAILGNAANTRSEYDLVQSCVLTVLACVWTSAHPNIPGPRDSTWTCYRRRLVMMIYALIAPEIVVMWALRQWVAARRIAKNYNHMVLGLPQKEMIPLWKQLWNLVKGSWSWAKECFIQLSRIFLGRRNGQARRAAAAPYATIGNPTENENPSLRERLSDWFQTSIWVSPKESFRDFFVELPEERTRRGKGQPWTITHGFFIQMGGFLLYENDYPKQVLDYDAMEKLIRNKQIDAPIYTEADIHDRSKGGGISKAVVVFQTTWFVVQCITRRRAGLQLSELEVATLGFALLNVIIYAIWWHKPQDVGLAIFIPMKVKEGRPQSSVELQKAHLMNSPTCHGDSMDTQDLSVDIRLQVDTEKGARSIRSSESISIETVAGSWSPLGTEDFVSMENSGLERQATDDAGSDSGTTVDTPVSIRAGGSIEGTSETATLIQENHAVEQTTVKRGWQWLQRKLEKDRNKHHWLFFALVVVPLRFWGFLLRPLMKMMDSYSFRDGAHRVPMFYANSRGIEATTIYTSCAIGTLFGAVHLLAWSSVFPSRTELFLWRISTLIIMAEPILVLITRILSDYNTRLGTSIGYPVILTMPLYAIARFTLIILSFLSLHTLPPSAFVTIPWTTFIPHL